MQGLFRHCALLQVLGWPAACTSALLSWTSVFAEVALAFLFGYYWNFAVFSFSSGTVLCCRSWAGPQHTPRHFSGELWCLQRLRSHLLLEFRSFRLMFKRQARRSLGLACSMQLGTSLVAFGVCRSRACISLRISLEFRSLQLLFRHCALLQVLGWPAAYTSALLWWTSVFAEFTPALVAPRLLRLLPDAQRRSSEQQ